MEAPTVEPIFIRKSQLDMFGGVAPEVPKIPANPKTEKLGNLSIEHKQIYNNLLDKQKKNKLLPEENGHLKNFNQYLSGGITHEQLKGYIGYKQNENHLPLFGNAPEVPKIDAPKPAPPPPQVNKVEANTNSNSQDHPAPFRAKDSDALIHYGNVGDVRGEIGNPKEVLEEISIDKLTPDHFAEINHNRVSDYAKRDTELPPIEVHRDGDENFIYDGNHRFKAAKAKGQKSIKAWVSTVGNDGFELVKADTPAPTVDPVKADTLPQADKVEKLKEVINHVAGKTGLSFNKSRDTNSWYFKDGERAIRLSDHPSKFVEKQTSRDYDALDLNLNYHPKEALVHLIKGTNPFEGYTKGDKINHSSLGDMEYLDSDHKKGWVEALTGDNRRIKYDIGKFLGQGYKDNTKGLKKSQLSMFGDEPPKVDPIKVDTPKVDPVKVDTPKVEPAKIDAPKVASVSGSENFLKPEHKLESEDGVWKVKGDSAATSQLHSWLKDKYKKKEIYTYGGLLNSGHPVADKVKELHGDDNKSIFQHFNKITGRESGRELGVGENQLRMSLKDSAGMQLGDKHFQVPDLSEEAKVERDSFPNGAALHNALNNREVSPELHKWHRDYTFNSYHKKADSGEHYERSLYNNKTEDFGKPKTKPEDNLKPKELERYNALKDAHINEPFTDTHKKRLEDLTAKDNNKKHLSEKFSPEDKKVYDDILKQKDETKALIDSKDLTLAQKEPHKAKQKELHGQETEMLANYRQKLGLGRGDETGQKGFSYTEGLNDDEAKEMDHLTDKQEFTKLHSKYTQAPEENHISKLLKYPMSSNQKVFDDNNEGSGAQPTDSKAAGLFSDNKPAPSRNSAGIDDNEDEGMDPEPDLTDPKQKIESHFPTTGIVSSGSFQKTLKEYGHRPQDSQRPFPANSTIEFNGEKHSVERDGGTYLMTKNLATGKTDVIPKADVEQFPSDRKIPRIDKFSVEDFMNEHGDEGLSLEDVYSKMGLPDDIKGKDHIKKKLKSALLQLEHHHETGGFHAPKVEREVGKAHPKETDEKEKGILYKLAKSMWDYTAQTISYIKEKILIKSYMIDLTIQQKEKSIFEKSLEGKNIYETLMVLSEEEKSLCKTLDNIQAATLMKSGIPLVGFLNNLLSETTRYVVESGSRFDLLKSMDNGGFQKAVDAAVAYEEEEEKYTTYKYIKPTQNVEDNRDAETEE